MSRGAYWRLGYRRKWAYGKPDPEQPRWSGVYGPLEIPPNATRRKVKASDWRGITVRYMPCDRCGNEHDRRKACPFEA